MMSLNRQLIIFSAESMRPAIKDLAGLIIGPGHVTKMGGTARISVAVDAAWRVHALAAEFAARGLRVSWEQVEGGYVTHTAFTGVLGPLAEITPSFLDGIRLRLWYAAAGSYDHDGVLLGLSQDPARDANAIQALETLGLPVEQVAGERVLRIPGRGRAEQVAELIGEGPSMVPAGGWPVKTLRVPADASKRDAARPRLDLPDPDDGLW